MIDFLQNFSPLQIVAAGFLLTIILHIVLKITINFSIRQSIKSKNRLDDHLVPAISIPLKVLLWLGFIYFASHILKLDASLPSLIIQTIKITPLLIFIWILVRMISAFEAYLLEKKSTIGKDSVRLFSRIIKIFIIAVMGLAIAQSLGFEVSSIIAFGGVSGIVIGMAAKDMLANIFGGLMIQADKPFSTGDWIRVQNNNIEGVVEKIGWRMTRVRTFSKNPVYVPNSIFSSSPIETPSRMTNRRIFETIGIRYDDIDKAKIITEQIETLLKKHPDIDQKQPLRVHFHHFNDSSLDIEIYAFTTATNKYDFQNIKQQILFSIADIVKNNAADFAYPTQTLHLNK